MFKFIGGAVVYGFALLGLAKYLENRSGEGEREYMLRAHGDSDSTESQNEA